VHTACESLEKEDFFRSKKKLLRIYRMKLEVYYMGHSGYGDILVLIFKAMRIQY
jgi:hypothetical protein